MSFLAPWFLSGFAALAVPIIIHLWQRKRVVKVPFSTLRFLKIVAARTSRSAKIENLLLLLLRCLIFALIILAAARPVVSTETTRLFGGNVPRTIALVIDQSMSMTYKSGDGSRLERAKRQAQTVIDDLKPGDEVAVIAVGDQPRLLIAEPTVDHGAARQAIEGMQATEARTDFGGGLGEARKAVGKALRGMKQIFLFTDNQDSGWQFDRAAVFDEVWKKTGAKLVVVTPDDLNAVNAAVTKVRFDSPFAASGSMARGAATVDNRSAAPLRDLLEIKLAGDRVIQKPVEAAAGSAAEIPFEFQTPTILGRWTEGTAALSGDNLPGDDRHYFVLPVYQTPRVLIVEQGIGPERARSGFYLRTAMTAGAAGAPLKTVSPAELDDLPIEPFSAVFLAGVSNISDRSAVRLDRYLESGGTVVLFPSSEMDFGSIARFEFLPAKPEKIVELPVGRLPARAIEPQHPLFTNSWDANTPFPALPQRKMAEWKLNANGRVLLTLGDNLPFIIYGDRGTGRVIIVNASPDRAWGDLPLTPAFLPLVQQIGRLSMARTGREANVFVGDSVPAPLSLPRDQALSIKNPKGDLSPVPPGAALLERAEAAGFYEVSSATEGVLHQFAVNVDPRETNLTPITEDALAAIVPHERVVGVDALRLWLAQSRGLAPLWPLLLVLALLAFAGESIYSNFLASKRAQGDEEHIKTGRLNKRRAGQPFREAVNAEEHVEAKS
ncbi:MAG TPA: BatA and WFA domain-containing protein [Chthoniobacteraceae bacterium]|jgi:hypothetical protein|nr:BatA and WFA domain-containing protein [Chthoniobacteraceae bacterium]